MDKSTINPLIMLGTYLGFLAGFLLALKGWYIFWWLSALIGIDHGTPLILNIVGGMIAGYVLQILWRISNYHTAKIISKK
jgi:hypothetical protein